MFCRDWLERFDVAETHAEFADEISHYLVDVVGDADFAESRWFHTRHYPWIPLLQRLSAWDEQGRDPAVLPQLLAQVRQILAETI